MLPEATVNTFEDVRVDRAVAPSVLRASTLDAALDDHPCRKTGWVHGVVVDRWRISPALRLADLRPRRQNDAAPLRWHRRLVSAFLSRSAPPGWSGRSGRSRSSWNSSLLRLGLWGARLFLSGSRSCGLTFLSRHGRRCWHSCRGGSGLSFFSGRGRRCLSLWRS